MCVCVCSTEPVSSRSVSVRPPVPVLSPVTSDKQKQDAIDQRHAASALSPEAAESFLINPLPPCLPQLPPPSAIQPEGKEAGEMEGRGEKKKRGRGEIIRKQSWELRGISHLSSDLQVKTVSRQMRPD